MSDLINLFVAFFKVGSFSFGGAYSLLPLIESEVVNNHNWLSDQEFLKVLSMAEIFPGAISIKFATYTGYKVAGLPGVFVANLGNMITPAILILVAMKLYFTLDKNVYAMKILEGMKFVIIGIILAVLFKYIKNQFTSYKDIVFIVYGMATALFFNVNPIIIIIIGALFSLIIF